MTIAFASLAQEQKQDEISSKRADYPINDDYKSGANLIYDCRRGFYVCVDDVSYELCKTRREKDKDKKKDVYACAHLKKFSTHEDCGKKNYEIIELFASKRFCYPQNLLLKN